MSDTSKQYRTVIGVVQFDPQEREAGGKQVRNVAVGQVGFGQQAVRVSATLWPSHADFTVAKGDVILLEGTYTQGKGDKEGQSVTYHNLSVMRAFNFGKVNEGVRIETTTDDSDPVDEDDIPF